MSSILARRCTRLFSIGVLTLVPLIILPLTATAAERHTVVKEEEPGASKGGGVLLENVPGAYYMGRLWRGQTFDWHPHIAKRHTGEDNRSHYYFGHAGGSVQQCMWIGPSAHVGEFTKYLSGKHHTVENRCSQEDRTRLRVATNFGTDFNCKPKTGATFGTRKHIRHETAFYYNLQWHNDYSGGAPRDRVEETLKPGTEVYYRYTTKDKEMAVVYAQGLGWGFIDARAVSQQENKGYWHRPNGEKRIKCSQEPRT